MISLKENKRLKELIAYLFFGVLTTLVSFLTYFTVLLVGEYVIGLDPNANEFYTVRVVGEILQWVFSVLFAFFTNKKWVFTDANQNASTLKQLRIFAGSRLITLGIDAFLTFGTVWLLQALGYQEFTVSFIITLSITADLISKEVSSVFVVVINYFISKLLVFKK